VRFAGTRAPCSRAGEGVSDRTGTSIGTDRLRMSALIQQPPGPILAAWLPDAEQINAGLLGAFAGLATDDFARRSHFVGGRFENLYLDPERLPGVEAVLDFSLQCARDWPRRTGLPAAVASGPLRCGFWLNAMAPGDATSVHTHAESDELLSGVYYVSTPPGCGDLLFAAPPFQLRVTPQPGLLLLFPPTLPHGVEPNGSDALRLSVAFNIGPAAERPADDD